MLLRYSGAVACVAAGVLLALWLQPALDPEMPLLLAVLIAAWFAGLGPALLATVLGTMAVVYYFSPPTYSFALDLAHVPRVVLFALIAGCFATVSAARRKAEHSLKMAGDEMEARVRQRTAELQQTNDQLHAEIGERRRAEDALRERACLLDLTHDSVFVRDMNQAITLWNRERREQSVGNRGSLGRVSHELLKTVFRHRWKRSPTISSARPLERGADPHAPRRIAGGDVQPVGTSIERWQPGAVLETNNDITASIRPNRRCGSKRTCWTGARAIFVWSIQEQSFTGIGRANSCMLLRQERLAV